MSDPIPMEAAEECMAYLVEEAASADPRSPFRKWFDKLVAAIKQWLNAHSFSAHPNKCDFVEILKILCSALDYDSPDNELYLAE